MATNGVKTKILGLYGLDKDQFTLEKFKIALYTKL
jgi:hypothetical protein